MLIDWVLLGIVAQWCKCLVSMCRLVCCGAAVSGDDMWCKVHELFVGVVLCCHAI
jgi:hypothetical protein